MLPTSNPNGENSSPFHIIKLNNSFSKQKIYSSVFWNVHGKDIIFHSALAFTVLLNMTKVTSRRTGIK